jgi:hypothetical protein
VVWGRKTVRKITGGLPLTPPREGSCDLSIMEVCVKVFNRGLIKNGKTPKN